MKRKNIIYILADDIGIGDISCYNPDSKLHTPHLDALAVEGIRFTNAHSTSALCSPSRYSILTGRYNWRSWLKQFVLNMGDRNMIDPGRMTVASFLKERGYATACVGKWHLGLCWEKDPENEFGIDFTKPFRNGPLDCGFDYFYGLEASLNQPPYAFLENDRITTLPDGTSGVKNYWPGIPNGNREAWIYGPAHSSFDVHTCTEKLQEKAMSVLRDLAAGDKPFFLYYPTTAVHVPWLPAKEFEGTSGIGYYGDFVLMTDWMVGQLAEELVRLGIEEDTIVVFTSDNGSGAMTDLDRILSCGHNPSSIFRGYKGDIWEGGHRIPYIIKAPGLAQAGTKNDSLVSLGDFLATVADIHGQTLPPEAGVDSVSNLPLWQGRADSVREEMVYSSFDGSLAIQKGPWKLEMCPGAGSPSDKGVDFSGKPAFQLYRLDGDIGERRNLIEACPEIYRELRVKLAEYICRGRSTEGPEEKNDGAEHDFWKEIAWIREDPEMIV